LRQEVRSPQWLASQSCDASAGVVRKKRIPQKSDHRRRSGWEDSRKKWGEKDSSIKVKKSRPLTTADGAQAGVIG